MSDERTIAKTVGVSLTVVFVAIMILSAISYLDLRLILSAMVSAAIRRLTPCRAFTVGSFWTAKIRVGRCWGPQWRVMPTHKRARPGPGICAYPPLRLAGLIRRLLVLGAQIPAGLTIVA